MKNHVVRLVALIATASMLAVALAFIARSAELVIAWGVLLISVAIIIGLVIVDSKDN